MIAIRATTATTTTMTIVVSNVAWRQGDQIRSSAASDHDCAAVHPVTGDSPYQGWAPTVGPLSLEGPQMRLRSTGIVLALMSSVVALVVTTAGSASAGPVTSGITRAVTLAGTTSVTTAPGIAGTLIGAGVIPLPVPGTSFRPGYTRGLNVTYGFHITGGNPDLAGPAGDILHSGGIYFTSLRGKHLEIGKFDIDLAVGKIFATEVNFASARIPVLDLVLTNLKVTSSPRSTVLSGISLRLDPAAAGALNATFGIHLPTDGSLTFGSAVVSLRG